MRYLVGFCLLLSALLATRAAVAADTPNGALCALTDIQECDSQVVCERVTAEEIAAPRFIRLELAKRTLNGVGPRARHRVTNITTVDQRGDIIFAQGIEDEIKGERSAVGWLLALDSRNGFMRLTITGDGVSLVATGECLIDN